MKALSFMKKFVLGPSSFRACPTSFPIYIEMKLQHYYTDENCRQLLPILKHGKQKKFQYTLTSFIKKHSSKNRVEDKRKVLLSQHLALTEYNTASAYVNNVHIAFT